MFEMPEVQCSPDPFLQYKESLHLAETPIIIDNGSWQCRAGWASNLKPSFIFKNLTARNRGKKDVEIQVGNDISNPDVLRWLLKSQFDRNIVTQLDVQEAIFDHIFHHLGINTSSVEHPIILTEAWLNPNYSRQMMSELLFECYQVPKVSYGVDSLFAFHKNTPIDKSNCGLVVDCGYQCSHIIPIFNNQTSPAKSQRINVGGCQMISFLHRLLQLKYPGHYASITLAKTEELLHRHSYIANHYKEELAQWGSSDYYFENVHKIQLPYTPLPGAVNVKTLDKMELCKAMIEKLKEVHSKKRTLKIVADEEKLQQLKMIQELFEESDIDLFQRALREFGYSSLEDLQQGILKLGNHIQKQKSNKAGSVHYCKFHDLELSRFTKPEEWILAVRKKWEMFRDMSLEKLNRGQNGLIQSEELYNSYDLNQEFNEYELQENLQELGDTLREYEEEFNREHGVVSENSLTFNLAEYYQIHIGIERIRAAEVIFQPSMIGIDQAGLSEAMQNVLKRFDPDQQAALVKNVLVTGGCAKIPGFKSRLESELMQILPFQTDFKIKLANNPTLDAWNGARDLALTDTKSGNYYISKADYEEKGVDYFVEHRSSNRIVALI